MTDYIVGAGVRKICRRCLALILQLAAIFSLLFSPPAAIAGSGAVEKLEPSASKLVFAHYMLCCTIGGPNASTQAYAKEIALAHDVGIDGFALNIGAWRKIPHYINDADHMFAAAEADGNIRLFVSIDFSNNITAEEAFEIVRRYQSSPAYLKDAGRPVVSTYNSPLHEIKRLHKLLCKKMMCPFLIPHVSPIRLKSRLAGATEMPTEIFFKTLNSLVPEINGFFYFGGAGSPKNIAATSSVAAKFWQQHGKLYMAPVSPYYLGGGPNNRVFDNDGFAGMAREWRAAINAKAQWVELVTWNDWGENTYLRPLGPSLMHQTGPWGRKARHDSFLMASRLFIKWFKTGVRPNTRGTQLYFFYRWNLVSICQNLDLPAPCPVGIKKLSDIFYVFAQSDTPIDLVVKNGGVEHRSHIAAGWSQTKFALKQGPLIVTATAGGLRGTWRSPVTIDNSSAEDRLNMTSFSLTISSNGHRWSEKSAP